MDDDFKNLLKSLPTTVYVNIPIKKIEEYHEEEIECDVKLGIYSYLDKMKKDLVSVTGIIDNIERFITMTNSKRIPVHITKNFQL